MDSQSLEQKDLYYTNDHEWVDFKDTVAYTGICSFKLTGFKEIQEVIYKGPLGFKKKGDPIAAIKYNDYIIEAHMPVDGKVLEMNTHLMHGNDNRLLKFADDTWIAKIAPSSPEERNGLLLPDEYRMNGKGRYSK